jgi:ferric-dicitrate binding protein FerR (iron transport regulator)
MMERSIEARIGRYLSGEADAIEKEAFENELAANADLQQEFAAYQRIWEQMPEHAPVAWHTDSALHQFRQHFTEPIEKKKPIRRLSWAIAAVFVLAIGAAVLFLSNPKQVTYAFDPQSNGPIVLSDASKVYLNKDAVLRIISFQKKSRRVELTGEAFFEVEPDTDRPFFVEAGGTLTEVVGTAFNISQSPKKTSIYVSEGKVIFSSDKEADQKIALTSGEAATFEEKEIKRLINPSPNIHAWHSRQLSFNGMPLSEIVDDMTTYFGRPIQIEDDQIRNCRINSTQAFNDPKFEDVIGVVVASLNANMVMDGTTCIIRGGKCP